MNLVFTWQLSELTVVLTACPFPYHAPEGRTETLLVTYIPQMLATINIFKNVHFQILRPKGAQKPSQWYMFPNVSSTFSLSNLYMYLRMYDFVMFTCIGYKLSTFWEYNSVEVIHRRAQGSVTYIFYLHIHIGYIKVDNIWGIHVS